MATFAWWTALCVSQAWQIFEGQCHQLVAAGLRLLGPDDVRCLPPPAALETHQPRSAAADQKVAKQLISELTRSRKRVWEDGQELTDADADGVYLEPRINTQGAWDAVVWRSTLGLVILQYTTNPEHGVKVEYIKQLLQRTRSSKPPIMLFAVPADVPGDDRFALFDWQLLEGKPPKAGGAHQQHEQAVSAGGVMPAREQKADGDPGTARRRALQPQELPKALRKMQQWVIRVMLAPSQQGSGQKAAKLRARLKEIPKAILRELCGKNKVAFEDTMSRSQLADLFVRKGVEPPAVGR
jgi:hypothetical protein